MSADQNSYPYTPEQHIQILADVVEFRDKTIANLRIQINNLRLGLGAAGVGEDLIDELQFHHCRQGG